MRIAIARRPTLTWPPDKSQFASFGPRPPTPQGDADASDSLSLGTSARGKWGKRQVSPEAKERVLRNVAEAMIANAANQGQTAAPPAGDREGDQVRHKARQDAAATSR